MSIWREDIKQFDILSGQITISDALSDEEPIIVNAKPGGWLAFSEYDDDDNMTIIAAICESSISEFSDGRIALGEPVFLSSKGIKRESGIISIFDRKMHGRWPSGYKLPESLKSAWIVSELGEPDDPGKPQDQQFAELCMHLGQFFIRDKKAMSRVEPAMFGVAGDIAKGGIEVTLMSNEQRDVIGIEVHVDD